MMSLIHVIISISSVSKIPISLKAGLDKDIKDEFKSFITNNCYRENFVYVKRRTL